MNIVRIALVTALTAAPAAAQVGDYPSRPIRMVVGFAAGGPTDILARTIGQHMAQTLGQQIVVENRAGAAGTIAANFAVTQPPDGYTLLSDSSSHTIVPALMEKMPFDTARDIAGVTTLIENPLVLVSATSKGYRSARDIIAVAKANPGKMTYASAGVGTSTHISAEKFRIGSGWEGVHIPFKSSTDGLIEVLAGRIDFTYTALASAQSGIRDGKLVALAMVSRRVSVMPDVPSVEEIVPGASYSTWLGVMVNSKTPREIIARLNQAIVQIMHTADMKERLLKLGTEPWTMSAEEFDALRKKELVDNERLVKAANIKM